MSDGIEIAKHFIKATEDILLTMACMKAKAGVPYVKKNLVAKGDVSAVVGVTGDRTGTISVSFPRACAVALVKGMLGDDIEDIIKDTQDAVGELTNMISGQTRAAMAGEGIVMQGSTPSVIMGDGHTISHASGKPVMAMPFATEHGEFTVEFCF
ncbi:MAG: chemotaxis protein CheX [Desulfovibrio sp.]|jgi:chemotaxis protein CheX|nr:chemotaxis protein CheX [Desulfovibrio sp.]